MNILGIDTAAEVLNLAIINKGRIIVDYRINTAGKTHSALILPLFKNMLSFTEIELKTIAGVAVSIGPGSFTGLRIGLSTAKGIAFSLSIPIIGINTLESYAFKFIDLPGILCPIIKARRGEYYYSTFYKKNNNLSIARNYQCAKWNEIKNDLLKYNNDVYVFGYGLRDILEQEKVEKSKSIANINFVVHNYQDGNAANIALMGEKRIIEKKYDDIYNLSPFYISQSAAEMNKTI